MTQLAMERVDTERYLETRTRVRELMQKSDIGEALPMLQSLLAETASDPEIHFYLAEISMRMKDFSRARNHYHLMLEKDPLNADGLLRYSRLLHALGETTLLNDYLKRVSVLSFLSASQEAEMHWLTAHTCQAQQDEQGAQNAIEKAVSLQPWNASYLLLETAIYAKQMNDYPLPDFETLFREVDACLRNQTPKVSDWEFKKWIAIANGFLSQGHPKIAYSFAKCFFIINQTQQQVIDFLARAAAAGLSRDAVHELLLFLQSHRENQIEFAKLALIAAKIYENCGDWPLVDEWIIITKRAKSNAPEVRLGLLEIEASRCVFTATQLPKAAQLLEAVADATQSKSHLQRVLLLQGYVMVLRGELKKGLDKIEHNLGDDPDIEALYLWAKALQRAERPEAKRKDVVARLYKNTPVTPREQKFLEEIYVLAGVAQQQSDMNLIC